MKLKTVGIKVVWVPAAKDNTEVCSLITSSLRCTNEHEQIDVLMFCQACCTYDAIALTAPAVQ